VTCSRCPNPDLHLEQGVSTLSKAGTQVLLPNLYMREEGANAWLSLESEKLGKRGIWVIFTEGAKTLIWEQV